MDRRLQDLERRWRALGTPEAGLAYLLAFERTASDEQVVDLLRRVGVRRWRLVGVDGPVEGQVLPLLREAAYRLGPEPEADLTLPESVEGHATLEVRQRGVERTCEVTGGDGVRVEGQPLAGPRALADGDLLELGDARFVVEAQPDTPDHRAPATRRGWLTVVAPPARAGERAAFSDHAPLARVVPGDPRHVEWDPGQRRWVVRRLEGPAAPLAAGRVLATRGVEVRFVGLPDAVARADLRAHVERALARQRPPVQAGSILVTDGPDAGRAVPLVRGDNPLPAAEGLVLEVDLDDDPTRWVVRARSVPPGATWSVRGGGLYPGPDDGEVQPGRVVARSRGGRRVLRGDRAYELAVGEPLEPLVDAYLVVTEGPDAGLRFPLRVGSTRVGADGDSEVVLTDPAARGRGAEVEVRRGWRPTYDPPAWGPRFAWRPTGEPADVRPLEDGDAVEVGATRLVLRACSVGGPPRAWLTRLDGPRPGEAFPVDKFGLSLASLPWAAWDLAREQARLGACRLQVANEVLQLVGSEASIEGAPGRADLQDGDVLVVGGVRLRLDLSTPGAPVEGARLRPEADPGELAGVSPAARPAVVTPPHRVVRDVDLQTWSPALALSGAGELALVKKDEVALHEPDGALRWARPGGRTGEPWQPEPRAVAFDRDGRLLVAYNDGLLEVLALDDGRTLEQLRPPTKDAMVYLSATLVASPTEPLALVVGPRDAGSFEGTRDLRVVAWDLAAREVRWTHELTVGRQYPRPVLPATRGVFYWHVDRCRPGGFEFVDSITSRGSTVDGTTEPLPHLEGRPISALSDLDDEHLLVVAGGRLARWRREPPHDLDCFAGDGGESRRGPLAVSPDRRFAAVAGEQLLELWHLGARRRLHVAPLAGDRVLALELRDDGHAFVITFPSRLRVVAFDLTTAPPPRVDGVGPPPPPGASAPDAAPGADVARRRALAGSESSTLESTLKKAGDWFKGLLFEGP